MAIISKMMAMVKAILLAPPIRPEDSWDRFNDAWWFEPGFEPTRDQIPSANTALQAGISEAARTTQKGSSDEDAVGTGQQHERSRGHRG